MPEFENLPFNERPDLSPYLVHLTKNTKDEDEYSAFDNLVNILQTGRVWGSAPKKGFIKGQKSASCFMDIPLMSLKYVLNQENSNPNNPRYEPFGIIVTKKFAYRNGCRPVLYLSNEELDELRIPNNELWRVVRFEIKGDNWISWLHEREWRCKGNFVLPPKPLAVLVKNTDFSEKLIKILKAPSQNFKSVPKSIIPLTVLCQGLPYLKKYSKGE